MTNDNDALWRRRFQIFMLTRLVGVGTFLAGIAIAYTNLVRPGGWPMVGAILAICGALDAAFAPRLLKKMWAAEDAAASRVPTDGPTDA